MCNSVRIEEVVSPPRMRGMDTPSGLHEMLGLTALMSVFLKGPSPTWAKVGGGRHATLAVSPFVYVSLISVVE